MAQAVTVRVTANFEHNLESIRCYLHQHHLQAHFDDLLDKLFDVIIPNLQSHPLIGFDFLEQNTESVEALRKVETIRAKLPEYGSIRQYSDQDYIVLYSVHEAAISLLAIKHQRQLAFDLGVVE